jgi:glycerol-3-phosphate acyltransferase PlsX
MRIAVDATGGDFGASVVVPGAILGARATGASLALVGPTAIIETELRQADANGIDITVVDAPDSIEMSESAAQAVRAKPRSSIVVAINEVKANRAQAMVSAGHSGAVMASALFSLGRVRGIERPAIAATIPTLRGQTVVLDLGAVTDPKPQQLVQFALMAQVYAERIMGVTSPTVGLLSNGEEPSKGNAFVQQVYPLLKESLGTHFIGNIDGKDVPGGTVDIVVTDGFTGNVALKVAEGTATLMTELLRKELTATLPRKLAALFLRSGFRGVRKRLDYSETGGAPLLGIDGTVIISHGRSNQTAILNAIKAAKRSVDVDLPGGIRAAITRVNTNSEDQDSAAAPGLKTKQPVDAGGGANP